MTNRDREFATLNFGDPMGRGAVEETFYPWDLTVERFHKEGLPEDISMGLRKEAPEKEEVSFTGADSGKKMISVDETFLKVSFGGPVMVYEEYLGFDPVKRVKFEFPFGEESGIMLHSYEDWTALKKHIEAEAKRCLSEEQVEQLCKGMQAGHERGDFSVRLSLQGFFWIPRELFGVEEHLFAFYDEPEWMHEINEFILNLYETYLPRILHIIQPDVVYIQEDLSGKNGPMISPECFREFVGAYYQKLIPFLKEHGCGNVFVDTDGDFMKLIPEFLEAKVDGFLPMDVNAGMDIIAVREAYPKLKFIGGFNKLRIAEGKEAINREFERLLPVIRQGGYLPGADHQVPPSASFENYKYYISRLKEVMKQACADA